jgi:hypothetical protein
MKLRNPNLPLAEGNSVLVSSFWLLDFFEILVACDKAVLLEVLNEF